MNNVQEVLAFIKPLDGWLSSHEGFLLYTLAKEARKGEIVEIGSWKGKSTISLAAGSKRNGNAKITAIDPHLGEYTWKKGIGKKSPTFKEFTSNIRRASMSNWVRPLVETSKKAAYNWKKPISLLFIDGLHDYKNAYLDYSLWYPNVVNRGLVAFHDAFCGHKGPEEVVFKHILFNNSYQDIGVVGSIIFIQKGSPQTILQKSNIMRHRLLLPLAVWLHNSSVHKSLKFFLIHRIIKALLVNRYTFALQFKDI